MSSSVVMADVTSSGVDKQTLKKRIASIDILRGVVMIIMVMDHVRERLFFHMPVADPMDIDNTAPALYFSRLAAHLCAPAFVFLTGLSAWLYAQGANGNFRSPTQFLVKRGLFLIVLELTVIAFAWNGDFNALFLQVIWAIGISMIALGLLAKLPFPVVGAVGFLIVFGHNLLTPITFQAGETGFTLWSILHDRNVLMLEPVRVRASYPVLPWIGVIALGYFAGPLYARTKDAFSRQKILLALGIGCWALLLLLRGFNVYGETLPWEAQQSVLHTLMSFLNFTKYPPSLDYLLLTLGMVFILLAWLERMLGKLLDAIETFGSAPMFFYILHLYVLLVIYQILLAIYGANQGERFGVDSIEWVWLITVILVIALYFPTRAFAAFKHRSKNPLWRYL
ncbi:DUF1624 domain-containing protein [Alteromonas pelagimontana]|uniref:DUF1624 domain-containing protein n=1 Tax=Alteromonas pelagimontana TaxID=1858656 RepID=A0A6M4MC23_9ALTE|nr:DUF1624 domain-containing protein [Alteromonas pelagimontana]QJR80731.1 DUF1624 domain-containing protein [Alteromonas pelagimontana]